MIDWRIVVVLCIMVAGVVGSIGWTIGKRG